MKKERRQECIHSILRRFFARWEIRETRGNPAPDATTTMRVREFGLTRRWSATSAPERGVCRVGDKWNRYATTPISFRIYRRPVSTRNRKQDSLEFFVIEKRVANRLVLLHPIHKQVFHSFLKMKEKLSIVFAAAASLICRSRIASSLTALDEELVRWCEVCLETLIQDFNNLGQLFLHGFRLFGSHLNRTINAATSSPCECDRPL